MAIDHLHRHNSNSPRHQTIMALSLLYHGRAMRLQRCLGLLSSYRSKRITRTALTVSRAPRRKKSRVQTVDSVLRWHVGFTLSLIHILSGGSKGYTTVNVDPRCNSVWTSIRPPMACTSPVSYTHLDVYKRQTAILSHDKNHPP